jgi:hypothetical protein
MLSHQALCTCTFVLKFLHKGNFDRLLSWLSLFCALFDTIRCGNDVGHIAEHISSTHVHTERQLYRQSRPIPGEFSGADEVKRRLDDQTYNHSSASEFVTIQAAEEAGYTRQIRIKVRFGCTLYRKGRWLVALHFHGVALLFRLCGIWSTG